MSNFSTAISATETAENSAGSAMKENSKYMESLSAKLNALKGQLQELVIGDGSLSAFMKGVVDAGTAILKFANSDVGKTIIQLTLAYTGFTLAAKGITKFTAAMADTEKVTGIIGLIKNVKAAITAFKGAETATQGFEAALGALNINPVVLGLTAAVAGAIGLYKAYKYLNPTADECNKKFDEQSEALKKVKSAYEEAQNDVKEQEDNLSKIDEKIQAINSKGTLTITDQQQLTLLQNEKKELQQQLDLKQAQLDLKKQEVKEEVEKTLNEKHNVKIYKPYAVDANDPNKGNYIGNYVIKDNAKDNVEQLTEAIKACNKQIDIYQKLIDEINKTPENDRTLEQKNNLKYYTDQLGKAQTGVKEMNSELVKQDGVITDAQESYESVGGSLNDVQKGILDTRDASMDLVRANNASNNTIKDSDSLLESANSTLGTNCKSLEEVADKVKDAGGDYKAFSRAVNEKRYDDANSILKEMAQTIAGVGDESEKSADDVDDFTETFSSALANSMSNISSIQSAYGNLKAAVDEYNKSGQISFETLSSIISQNPAYLACLDDSSGKLSINEAMLKQQFNAQKQAAIATLEAARSFALEQVQLGATADQAMQMAFGSKQLTTQVGQSGNAALNASTSYSNAGNAASSASGGIDSMTDSVTGLTGAMSDGIAMGNQYNNMLKGGQGNSGAKGSYSYKGTTGGMPSDVYNQWKKQKDISVNKNAEKLNKMFDSFEKNIKNLSWKNIKVTATVPSSGGGRSGGGGSRRGSKGRSGGSGSTKSANAEQKLNNQRKAGQKYIDKYINSLKAENKTLDANTKKMQKRIDNLKDQSDYYDDLKGYIDDRFDDEIDEYNTQIDKVDKQIDEVEDKYENMTVSKGIEETGKAVDNLGIKLDDLKDIKDKTIDSAIDSIGKQIDAIDDAIDKYKKEQQIIRDNTVYTGKLVQYQGQNYHILKQTLKQLQRAKEDDADILQYTQQISDLQYQLSLSENEGSIKHKQDQVDAYQTQIDALQKQIDDQKEINDELDKQIERQKLLDALSAAKNKRLKVYQKGKGFTYTQDFDAIKEAQDNLDNYDREHKTDDLQKQIDDLEKKQKVLNDEITAEKDYYQKQIDALQWAKDKKEKFYDDQINDLQRFIDDCDDKYDDATDDTVDAYLIQQKARKDDLENQEYYLEKLQSALDKEYEAQKENLEDTKQMVQDKKDAFDKEYEAYEKHVEAVELFKEAGVEEGKSMLDQTAALDAFVDHAIAKYKEWDKARKTYAPQMSQNKKSISSLDKDIDKQGEYKDQAKDAKTIKGAKKANNKSKKAYKKTNKKVVSNTNLGSYKGTMQQKAADLQVQVDNGNMSTEEAAKAFNTANKKAKKKYGLKSSEGYKDKKLNTRRWGNVTTEKQRINAGGKLTPAKYQKETDKTDKKGNKVRIGTGNLKKISIQGKIKKPLTKTAKMGTVTTPKKKTTIGKKTTATNKKKTTTSNKKKTTTNKKKTPKNKKKYTGDPSISKSGVYLVGDKPSQELVIGSKLNGVPLNLDKGTGVVNAKSTSTLAGMLNTLSSDKEHIGTLNKNTSTTNNDNLSIGSVTVSGANIDDGESFVASLKTLKQEALQRAYRK